MADHRDPGIRQTTRARRWDVVEPMARECMAAFLDVDDGELVPHMRVRIPDEATRQWTESREALDRFERDARLAAALGIARSRAQELAKDARSAAVRAGSDRRVASARWSRRTPPVTDRRVIPSARLRAVRPATGSWFVPARAGVCPSAMG
ncbi:hypothetical protein HNR16_003413 [Pseudoclavibacter chungangensis]|nr:hypothetical protein [Pseudoclavibacter chungangensis]